MKAPLVLASPPTPGASILHCPFCGLEVHRSGPSEPWPAPDPTRTARLRALYGGGRILAGQRAHLRTILREEAERAERACIAHFRSAHPLRWLWLRLRLRA